MKRKSFNNFKIRTIALVLMICLASARQTQAASDNFISLAYVSLSMLKLDKAEPHEVKSILDKYRWEGISDVALIGGIYMTGKDGSIITSWNKTAWPPVFIGNDYKGDPINETAKRTRLCSRELINEVVNYFKGKGMQIWLSQTAAGWLTGGSFGVVLEDPTLTKSYAAKLNVFARRLGCIGVDFDWEFPPNQKQAEGYRNVMSEVKKLGLKVSVCAIQPTASKAYLDQCIDPIANINGHAGKFMKWDEIIDKETVDMINVMQYLGYNSETKELDVRIKAEKMALWETVYPKEFTADKKVKMLCGIGYYSYLLPEYRKDGKKGTKNMQALYDEYGKKALKKKVINGHAVWTNNDVREIVKYAKQQGWSGVFTWLVSHDVTVDVPAKYSRQEALSKEVKKIWKKEKNK